MGWKQRLQLVYLRYLSRPAQERCLYRAIMREGVSSIVEMGMGGGVRSGRLISAATLASEGRPIRFTGIDLFEARPAESVGLTLKQAHRLFKPRVQKLQLVPGDPFAALSRTANALGGTDLLVIGADQAGESLERAWFYVPRMLHAKSLVFLEERSSGGGNPRFRRLDAGQIMAGYAAKSSPRAA